MPRITDLLDTALSIATRRSSSAKLCQSVLVSGDITAVRSVIERVDERCGSVG
ncbi:MAG: hypothetical protein ACK5O2_05600 [Microthrixaceae bacterium]